MVIRDKRKFDSDFNLRSGAGEGVSSGNFSGRPAASPDAAELSEGEVPVSNEGSQPEFEVSELTSEVLVEAEARLAERTADLQRLTAEYANYRKRVDRDRTVVGEVASARVLEALLPVLDDIDRAAEHGDLTGAFKSVAEKLITAVSSLGLSPFGAAGDAFDPAVHEAVMHGEGDDVSVPTATTIMRRGYRINERLIRPAMVGVTDPAVQAN